MRRALRERADPTDLEATLRSIDGLLGHHDLVDREASLINQGYGVPTRPR